MRLALIAAAALLGCDGTEAIPEGVGLSQPCPRTTNTAYVKTVDQQGIETFWHADDVGCIPVFTDPIGKANPTAAQKHAAVGRAIDVWNRGLVSCGAAACLVDAGADPDATAVGHNPDGSNANVVTFIDTRSGWNAAFAGKRDAFAITLITSIVGSGQMVDADIYVNEGFFNFTVVDDPPSNRADLESVITHEIGHLIGFDHNGETQSMMYEELMTGVTKRDLHSIDSAGLCELYACY